jgi:hypothetical protein
MPPEMVNVHVFKIMEINKFHRKQELVPVNTVDKVHIVILQWNAEDPVSSL